MVEVTKYTIYITFMICGIDLYIKDVKKNLPLNIIQNVKVFKL